MDYPESLRSSMFKWYEEPPSVISRLEPKTKDVSPCSEYTRYTVEGVLKDPRSRFSAILDVNSLGPIFINSTLKDPKWSSRLGYGMAVVGEDTRIHIHRNGKYIIRRALDREHAESTYKIIVQMMKPVLFDADSDRFLWDLLKEMIIEKKDPGTLSPMIAWPLENSELATIIDNIKIGVKEVDDKILSTIRSALITGSPIDAQIHTDKIHEMLIYVSQDLLTNVDITLGRYISLIWALRAIEFIDDRTAKAFIGVENWDVRDLPIDDNSDLSEDVKVRIARIHFLLSPVPGA